MDEDDVKGTVLDALADAAIEATQLALNSVESGRFMEASETLSFVDRITHQVLRIEDHNKSENRSGAAMMDIMKMPSAQVAPGGSLY